MEIIAIIFHQLWQTVAKMPAQSWWQMVAYNATIFQRYVPILHRHGKWWKNLPLFFISTGKQWQKILVALGGIIAIDFHRYVPILHHRGKWWQMMDKMPPFSTLFINPLFFSLFFTIDGNTHLSSFQYSIVFHRNRWHFYRRVGDMWW